VTRRNRAIVAALAGWATAMTLFFALSWGGFFK